MSKISDLDQRRTGQIIALARQVRRLKLDPFATYIGCDHSTLIGYEKGRRPIPADRVETIAAALDLDPALIDPRAA